MKIIKKTLAVVLTALMLISAVPLSSFAAVATDETTSVANDVTVMSIQVFDMQTAKFNENTLVYDIPEFSYKLVYSDGSSVVKSSADADKNLVVQHNQKKSPWIAGSQENYFTVAYQGARTSASATVPDISNFWYYEVDGGVCISGISDDLSGAVTIPSQINGQPVISISGINKNITEITIPESVKNIVAECLYTEEAENLKKIIVSSKNSKFSSSGGVLYDKAQTKILAVPYAKTSTIKFPATVKTLSYINGNRGYINSDITIKPLSNSEYFSYGNGVIYNKDKTKIIYANKTMSGSYAMPSTVKTIADGAFIDCDKLTSVKISNSVTTITYNAFYSCDSLKSVTLPTKLKTIEMGAFSYCSKLPSISLPSTLKTIGPGAFRSTGLKSLTIPNSVTSLGEYAFANSKIATLKIGSGIKTISTGAFEGIPVKKLTIPNNVVTICDFAFYDCSSMTTLSLGKKVKTIGDDAFFNCCSLKTLTLPSSVTNIGRSAFNSCSSLKELVIPNNVTELGASAFANCSSLNKLTIGTGIKAINSGTFVGCAITSVTIPNNVTLISSNAFAYNNKLKTVSIGSGVKELSVFAFSDCDNLSDITVNSKNKKFSSYEGAIYNKSKTEVVICPSSKGSGHIIPSSATSIGQCAFHYNSKVKSVIIPNTVTEIGYSAFLSCDNLTSITLPNKLKVIPPIAFAGCAKLVSVTIPKSVKTIGGDAFGGCSKLKHVYYAGTKSQWKAITIDVGNESLLNATIHYNSKGCTHKYSKGADLTCNTCGYFEILPTTRTVSCKKYYYDNGKKMTSFTGVVTINKKATFIKKGVVTANLDSPKVKVENTKTGVKISWNKVTAAKTYKIYRSVFSGGKWSDYKVYKTTTNLNFTDKVKSGTKVRYTVYAYNGSIKSKYKTGVIIKHLTTTTPKATKASNGVKISWKKVTGANSYLVYRREYKNGKWSELKAIKKTSSLKFTDKTAKKNVKYQYTVKACFGDYRGAQTYSNSVKR